MRLNANWQYATSARTREERIAAIEKNNMPELTKEAVKWRMLALTLQEVRSAFEDLSPEEMNTLIREAAREARNLGS